jgi:hypothetical protein
MFPITTTTITTIATAATTTSRVAPCAGKLAMFFPPTHLKTADRNAAVATAKAICATCIDAEACLAGALARCEVDGVWGGELLRDGEVIPAYVGPGRPRKIRPVATPVAA